MFGKQRLLRYADKLLKVKKVSGNNFIPLLGTGPWLIQISQLRRKKRAFPASAGFGLPLAQNNPYARGMFWSSRLCSPSAHYSLKHKY